MYVYQKVGGKMKAEEIIANIIKKFYEKHPQLKDDKWVNLNSITSCLDGDFTAEELRAIADVMDDMKGRVRR